ncbi:MAG: hypothetical protein N2109_07375, partial [Fimbriimonadales bacterium]|nr:hypothetical protein [Fimbriimonadales bacterium]
RAVLYEQEGRLGGRLWLETPEPLEPEVLEGDVERLLRLGVQAECGASVGGVATLLELLRKHDAAIIACGSGSLGLFPDLQQGPKGLLVSRHDGATSMPRVYAAGSIVDPSLPLVRRVASGKRAAEGAHREIVGHAEPNAAFSVHVGRMAAGSLQQYLAVASPACRNSKANDPSANLTAEEAREEALRCLRCACPTTPACRLRRLAIEYGADPNRFDGARRAPSIDDSHPELVFEPGKCISCGICVRIVEQARKGRGMATLGRGFDLRIGPPLGASLEDALGDTARRCAEACPTSALHLRPRPKQRHGDV